VIGSFPHAKLKAHLHRRAAVPDVADQRQATYAFEGKLMVVRSFGVLSVGKIMAAMYAFFGLLIGGMFTLLSLGGLAAAGGRGGPQAILFGVGAIIALPIFYGLLGFIGGVLSALIYNLLAGVAGGVEVYFDEPEPEDYGDEAAPVRRGSRLNTGDSI
jgi:hypothetical protein